MYVLNFMSYKGCFFLKLDYLIHRKVVLVIVPDKVFVICQPQQQPEGLVAASLDLVTMLLKVMFCVK